MRFLADSYAPGLAECYEKLIKYIYVVYSLHSFYIHYGMRQIHKLILFTLITF